MLLLMLLLVLRLVLLRQYRARALPVGTVAGGRARRVRTTRTGGTPARAQLEPPKRRLTVASDAFLDAEWRCLALRR